VAKKQQQNSPAVAVPRSDDGKLLKGAALNPGGRSKSERDVVEAARLHGVAIIAKLAEMFFEGGNVEAGKEILNRAYGKAKQKVELTGVDDGPIQVAAVRELLAARFVNLLSAEAKKK